MSYELSKRSKDQIEAAVTKTVVSLAKAAEKTVTVAKQEAAKGKIKLRDIEVERIEQDAVRGITNGLQQAMKGVELHLQQTARNGENIAAARAKTKKKAAPRKKTAKKKTTKPR